MSDSAAMQSASPTPEKVPEANQPSRTTPVPPAIAGAAGSSAMPPSAAPQGKPEDMMKPASADPPAAGPAMPHARAMDECGLKTQWSGDEYCILPPPADKGFQLHVGPKDYANPGAEYILGPGEEKTNTFTVMSGNDKEVYFYYRQYRMRPGAHHNILSTGNSGDIGLGQRIGTVNSLSEDYPHGGVIAPENEGVGIKLPPHTPINVSLHSINTSQKPELREIWVNFWYRDPSEVTQPVKQIFVAAPMEGIAPGADVVIKGACDVKGEGRMLWAYGHRHANNVRFSVWRERDAKRDLVYQGYNWEETLVLDYSSTVMNPMPDTAPGVEGGWSGILDMKDGDKFVWECHVINKTDVTLNFTNNTYTGEMCILDGESVGASCGRGAVAD